MSAMTPAVKERQKKARARASRIRDGITSYIHTLGDIATAHAEGDWKTLGYESWDEYVAKEFSADRVRLPVPQRQKAVEELRLAGLSNRAIAAAVNVAETTVRRDLAATNVAPIEGEIVDSPAKSPVVEAMTGAIEDADARAKTAGLAGPAPDAEQASVASGTAAEGADIPPSAAPQDGSLPGPAPEGVGAPSGAPQDHPGSSSPGEAEPVRGVATGPGPAAPEGDTCESPSGAPQDVPDAVNVDAGPDEAAAVQPAAAPSNHPGDASNAPGVPEEPAETTPDRSSDAAGAGPAAPAAPLDAVLEAIDALAAETGICPACRRPLEQ